MHGKGIISSQYFTWFIRIFNKLCVPIFCNICGVCLPRACVSVQGGLKLTSVAAVSWVTSSQNPSSSSEVDVGTGAHTAVTIQDGGLLFGRALGPRGRTIDKTLSVLDRCFGALNACQMADRPGFKRIPTMLAWTGSQPFHFQWRHCCVGCWFLAEVGEHSETIVLSQPRQAH